MLLGVVEMICRLFGVVGLISACAAQAAPDSETYAKVGDWEITAIGPGQCTMVRFYPGSAANEDEGLIVQYDTPRKEVALTWVSRKPKIPPLGASLDLDLAFFEGSSTDETWDSQVFKTEKRADSYGFSHVFAGPSDGDRFLRDLAAHDTFAIFLSPVLMTGLPLDASNAVTKLRECALKMVDDKSE